MQFDIPANSQILGKIAADAGIDAILYPSVKRKANCMAVFTQNVDLNQGFKVSILGETQDTIKFKEIHSGNLSEVLDS